MTEVLPEGVGTSPTPSDVQVEDSTLGDEPGALARFTIHVPSKDNAGREIPHVLDNVRRALGDAGFPGRTVVRSAQGDWAGDTQNYVTEEMDLVMVDAPDTPETLETMKMIGQGVKDLAGQEAVYITVQPLRTYLI